MVSIRAADVLLGALKDASKETLIGGVTRTGRRSSVSHWSRFLVGQNRRRKSAIFLFFSSV